jgi:preprotein translocase subunit SecG
MESVMEMPSWLKWTIALAVGLAIIGLSWWKAPILLTIFFVMLCFVLIVVVLLQSGSAADLAGAFGGAGSQAAFNPRGAATFLSKATTWCAIMFMISAMALGFRQERPEAQGSSILERSSKPAPKPAQSPATKGSAPVTQTPPPQSPQQPLATQQQPSKSQPLPAKKP